MFAGYYAYVLSRKTGGSYRVRPQMRLERKFGDVKLAEEDEVEPLLPWGFVQGSRMRGCDPMHESALTKPLPAKPRFFRSMPKRAEPIFAWN